MNWIISKLLRRISINKLASLVWRAVHPKLVAMAKRTDTEIDDEAVELLDTVVRGLIDDLPKESLS